MTTQLLFPVIYVDVDDTFIRSVGTTRIPMPLVIEHIRMLHAQGAYLYCWSSGGSEYAQASACEVGIESCFRAFLPKPQVMLDDQSLEQWRRLVCIHPAECSSKSLDDYQSLLEHRKQS
jgi:hypothetical protein